MFAPLFGAIHADIARQIGWTNVEVKRHTVLIGAIAAGTAFASLGAVVVCLVALYSWIVTRHFLACAMVGGGFLVDVH